MIEWQGCVRVFISCAYILHYILCADTDTLIHAPAHILAHVHALTLAHHTGTAH